jgi:hypothetical protein
MGRLVHLGTPPLSPQDRLLLQESIDLPVQPQTASILLAEIRREVFGIAA